MNILILSAGTRNKIVEYFVNTLNGTGKVIVTDMSNLAPAIYEADKYYIVPKMTYLINIGNNVTVSTNVTFVTHDNSIKLLYPEKSDVFGKIVIGNNCFIGENVTILYGVTLADNIIVAAGSVVTKSFRNSNIIIGGNPAHIINTWDKFSEKIKDNVITRKEMENCKERDSSFLISR